MKCLLCGLNCSSEKVIKKHYVNYHQIKENDTYFKDLFLPDTAEKNVTFVTKKQFGGSKRSTLLINILKRESITYFSINYIQHKHFYDFSSSVYEVYHPQENKIQAFFEIINKQRGEVILEDNRAW